MFSSFTIKASAPYTTRTVNRYGEVIETQGAYDPIQNIKDFIKDGESQTFKGPKDLFIDKDDLKFYNPDVGDYYLAQCYTFYIGQDSQDAENKEIKINF